MYSLLDCGKDKEFHVQGLSNEETERRLGPGENWRGAFCEVKDEDRMPAVMCVCVRM